MSRTLTAAVEAAFGAAAVSAVAFVEMDFSSGFLRVTNAPYTIAWNGYDWLGLGQLGGIDPVEEGADLQVYELKLRLSGVPPEHISIALGEHYQGRDCRVWVAGLSAAHAILADPVKVFDGRMDIMTVEMGTTAVITLSVQSRLADWNRPRVRRYNDADHQAEYPGDRFFEFAEEMTDAQIVWDNKVR